MAELEAGMSSHELAEWQAFDRLEYEDAERRRKGIKTDGDGSGELGE